MFYFGSDSFVNKKKNIYNTRAHELKWIAVADII